MPPRNKNTVIEFVGLPGAGKSTITARLISLLTHEKICVDNYLNYHQQLMGSKIGKLYFILFVLSNSLKVYGLVSALQKDIPLNRYSRVRIIKLLILIFAIKRYYNQKPKEVLVLDQGLIQMIASIYIPHFSKENRQIDIVIEKAFNLLRIDIDYQMIKVNTALETAKKRIYGREKRTCEFRDLTEIKLLKILNTYKLFFARIPSPLTISSENTVNTNVSFIYDHLFSQ